MILIGTITETNSTTNEPEKFTFPNGSYYKGVFICTIEEL